MLIFNCFRIYEDDFEPEEVGSDGANVESKGSTGNSPLKKAAVVRDPNLNKKDEIYDFSSNDLGY